MVRAIAIVMLLVAARPATAGGANICQPLLGTSAHLQYTPLTTEQMARVWGGLEDFWSQQMAARGIRFRPSKLVLYKDRTDSLCGEIKAKMGPLYCPGDQSTYIDPEAMARLAKDFGWPGEGATVYVLAHEYGHHIFNLMGLLSKIQRAQQNLSKTEKNFISKLNELTTDGLAGFFMAHLRQRRILDDADIAHMEITAWNVGDDHVSWKSRQPYFPDCAAHGTSKQRREWFRRGYEALLLEEINAFGEESFLNQVDVPMRPAVANLVRYPLIKQN